MKTVTQAFGIRQWRQGSWVWWTGKGWCWNESRKKVYGSSERARDAAAELFAGLGVLKVESRQFERVGFPTGFEYEVVPV